MGIWGGLIYLAFAVAVLMVIHWYIKSETGAGRRGSSHLLDMRDAGAGGNRRPKRRSSGARGYAAERSAHGRFSPQ